jgi:hypothetical protein
MHHWSFLKSESRFDFNLMFNFGTSGNILIDYKSVRSLGSSCPPGAADVSIEVEVEARLCYREYRALTTDKAHLGISIFAYSFPNSLDNRFKTLSFSGSAISTETI